MIAQYPHVCSKPHPCQRRRTFLGWLGHWWPR